MGEVDAVQADCPCVRTLMAKSTRSATTCTAAEPWHVTVVPPDNATSKMVTGRGTLSPVVLNSDVLRWRHQLQTWAYYIGTSHMSIRRHQVDNVKSANIMMFRLSVSLLLVVATHAGPAVR